MLKTYRDKVRCPEGHSIVIAARKASSAGKRLSTYCELCNKSYQIVAGPLPKGFEVQAPRALRESQVETQLVKRVEELGGEVRKVKWIGRNGAPDRLVMLPFNIYDDMGHGPSTTIWVELKATGKKAAPHQLREHERMRAMGQRVEVVDSFERIEEILK